MDMEGHRLQAGVAGVQRRQHALRGLAREAGARGGGGEAGVVAEAEAEVGGTHPAQGAAVSGEIQGR